jgi:hypothetical protein
MSVIVKNIKYIQYTYVFDLISVISLISINYYATYVMVSYYTYALINVYNLVWLDLIQLQIAIPKRVDKQTHQQYIGTYF